MGSPIFYKKINKKGKCVMLKVSLGRFASDVYGIDFENLFEGTEFYFSEIMRNIEVDEQDKKIFLILAKKANLEINEYMDIDSLVKRAMFERYVRSYLDEVYEKVKKTVVKHTLESFKYLNETVIYDEIQFDLYNPEISTEEQIEMLKKDFSITFNEENNEFVFDGSMEKLALSIIAVVHGYGMFRFSSLKEFADQYENEKLDMEELKKAITSHFHWLNHYQSIYGSRYFDIDKYDLFEYIDSLILGDFDFELDDVIVAYDYEVELI